MEGLADKIRSIIKKAGVNEPPVNLEKITHVFSIKIIPYAEFPDNISGTIVHQKGFVVIGVNSNHPIVRQRFTIAHELGHFFEGHDLSNKIVDDVFDKTNDKEGEANKFAAELLMPRDFLKQDIGKSMNIPLLAKKYNVSEQSISIRLLETGLINKF